jgi:hypothetical protein
MKELEAFLEKDPAVHNPLSIADYLAEMNDLMGEGERVPETREKVSNLLFLLEGQEGVGPAPGGRQNRGGNPGHHPQSGCRSDERVSEAHRRQDKRVSAPRREDDFFRFPLSLYPPRPQFNPKPVFQPGSGPGFDLSLRFLSGSLPHRRPLRYASHQLYFNFGFWSHGLCRHSAGHSPLCWWGSVSIGIGIDYALHWLNRFRWEIALLSSLEHLADKGMEFSAASGPSPSLPLASAAKKGSPSPSASSPLIAAVEKTLRSAGKAIFINMGHRGLGFLSLVAGELNPAASVWPVGRRDHAQLRVGEP